jgi:hypothetical protein
VINNINKRRASTTMKLTAYHHYLLYNGNNPANKIVGFNNRNNHFACGRPNLWAAEFVSNLIKKDRLEWASDVFIGKWASIESLSCGSYQRNDLDAEVANCLRGSGRWLANDNGGHFKMLKEKTVEWLLMDWSEKKFWKALSVSLDIWPEDLERYAQKVRKYKILTNYFNMAEKIAETSIWDMRYDRSTGSVFVKAWSENDPDSEVMFEVRTYQDIHLCDLTLKYGIDFETLDSISDYLDDNNLYIELDSVMNIWNQGPWFFKIRN